MTVRFYSSVAQETQLTASITGSSTVIQVASTTGFPSSTPFTLSLDYESIGNELVDVTGVAGTSLTVTRGVDGTSATSHNAGARVRHVTSARDSADSRAHENASQNVHGIQVGSSVVGTTDTQTLTNKTFSAVTVASPTITGTVAGGATYSGITMTNTPTVTGNMDINGSAAGTAQLDVMAAASQSAAIQRWLDSGGATLASITGSGVMSAARGATIANTGTGNVTATVTGVASQTADILQVKSSGGTTYFSVAGESGAPLNGGVTINSGIIATASGVDDFKFKASTNATAQVMARFSSSTNAVLMTVDDNGLVLANSFTELVGNAWQAFTPVWTTAGTAPALGNGTLAGRFFQRGKTIHVQIKFVAGTTTTFGTLTWNFSTPSGFPAASGLVDYIGDVFGNDSSAATFYSGTAFLGSGGTTIQAYLAQAGTVTTNVTPYTWATGDRLWINMTYETA